MAGTTRIQNGHTLEAVHENSGSFHVKVDGRTTAYIVRSSYGWSMIMANGIKSGRVTNSVGAVRSRYSPARRASEIIRALADELGVRKIKGYC